MNVIITAQVVSVSLQNDTDALLVDLARGLNPALLKGARVPSVERALRFVICFSTLPPSTPESENAVDACCDFVERLLHLLISLSVAEDKAIRFRAMQLAVSTTLYSPLRKMRVVDVNALAIDVYVCALGDGCLK